MLRSLTVACSFLALLAVAGCGDPGPNVSGELVKDGQPYKLGANEQCAISLVGDGNNMFTAPVSADGHFNFTQVVPAGKYKVGLRHIGDYSAGGAKDKKAAMQDKFGGAFADTTTPLSVDVSGTTKFVVDVGAKTVTKK